MYTHLAHLYDWPGTLDFTAQVLVRARECFRQAGLCPPGPVLDFACGTGGVAVELAKEGWRVIGLDCAEGMLAQARLKAQAAAVAVQWLPGDMRDFQLSETVEAVVCFCDSLNHLLTEGELMSAFGGIARVLKPGGLFLFDVNTLENYRELWQGQDRWEGPNYRLTLQASFDEASGLARTALIAEEYTDDGFQVRTDDVRARYYPEETIHRLLAEAGFEAITCEAFNPAELLSEGKPLKTFWQCRKG
jgi:ubiquinone/menaquinone biosynthesis C-methylase UbiE